MALNSFVWTDLSTFDMAAARKDYERIFGWSFTGDDQYDFALDGQIPVAAIFPMPQKMVEINMPSFWMSYIRVDHLYDIVDRAREHDGVIIEVEPTDFDEHSRIALVRDPSGAGFTLYEGPDITPTPGENHKGRVADRYHHLPDVGLIKSFYNDLFNWSFHMSGDDPWPVYDIRDEDGDIIARAEEVPETVRAEFRYWMPCFIVESTDSTLTYIKTSGGQLSADLGDGRYMVADRQGASFMIQPL